VVTRVEHLRGLVGVVMKDRLLQGDDVRVELAAARLEDQPADRPVRSHAQGIEGGDA